MVRALVAGTGITMLTRLPALAAPGIKPVRCIKRGESCVVGGTPCCGGKRAGCANGICVRIPILR